MSGEDWPRAQQAPPVCPRHPDVVSYVRCQRCGRPVCPTCQRPAAVGVQCVDCVAEAARTVRQPRTIFGGTVTDGRPVATWTLIGLCVAIFFAEQANPNLANDLAFVPALGWSEPWRGITAAFLHANAMHLMFNMLALWAVGPYLELLLGRARFVALYLISAVGGSVGTVLLATAPSGDLRGTTLSDFDAWFSGYVGASGAVFGLFGAYVVLNRHLGRSSAGMVVLIAINAGIGFVVPHIAWQAHLGGLVAGVAAAGILTWTASDPARRSYTWPALAGLLVVLVALAAAKYGGVPAGFR